MEPDEIAFRQTAYLILVAGGSGSGKTFLTERLIAGLGPERCALLAQDSYYRDLSHLPFNERERVNFDHPRQLDNSLLIEHLDQLRRGEAAQLPVYDFATHCRSETIREVKPRAFLLLEGVLALTDPEIRSRADLAIYVESPEGVRLERRLQRDLLERGRTREAVLRQFEETVMPMHRRFVEPSRAYAHLIVQSDADLPRIAELLVHGLLRIDASLPER